MSCVDNVAIQVTKKNIEMGALRRKMERKTGCKVENEKELYRAKTASSYWESAEKEEGVLVVLA